MDNYKLGTAVLIGLTQNTSKPTLKRHFKNYAIVLGVPLVSGGLGWLIGRKANHALMGGLVGSTLGLAGCLNFDVGVSPDASASNDAAMQKQQDMAQSTQQDSATSPTSDMTQQQDASDIPDMSSFFDFSQPDLTPVVSDMAKPVNCVNTLSGVGTKDFQIRFRVKTLTTNRSTLCFQSSVCGFQGRADYWSIRLTDIGFGASGKLLVAISGKDGTFTELVSNDTVNDGNYHDCIVQRINGVLSILIDNKQSGSSPCVTSFNQLPPLGVAKGDPCEGNDITVPLDGIIDNVCLVTP